MTTNVTGAAAESAAASSAASGTANRGSRRVMSAAGWLVTLIAVGYAFYIHNGLGVAPNDNPSEWWHATTFLLESDTVDAWTVTTGEEGRRILWSPGIVYLAFPALVLLIAAFLLTESAVARATASSAFFCVPLLAFYGLTEAFRIWEFFHWRASAVIAFTGLALGWTATAPFLAQSWMRQRGWLKVALYLPIYVAVVCLIRHATGTDEHLPFNFSPWPAVPVFGLEIGAFVWIGVLWGLGVALGAASIRARLPILAASGLIAGVLIPPLWFAVRFGTDSTNFLAILMLLTGALLALSIISLGSNRDSRLASRAVATLVGATLAYAPLATGRALATGDYTVNKFVHSQLVIDALAEFYANTDDGYPDDLQAVVDAGYLDAIPQPRVGFDLLYDLGWLHRFGFFYQSLGSSYVLEFTSTEWVQCAHNPPWEDEADDEDEYADEGGDAWSCPDSRPELW